MLVNISKEFRFEMSHRLQEHKGLCRNIHGHSYKLRVELTGETDSQGMVIDYYDLSQIVEPVVSKFDHSVVCCKSDGLLIDFLQANGFRHVILDMHTTAENLAFHFLKEIKKGLSEYKSLRSIKVKIFETEDVFAEITDQLMFC